MRNRIARSSGIGIGGLLPLTLLFTALLLNMGEMMLFSPGGMGMLLLVVIGFAASEKPQVNVKRLSGHG